MQNFVKAFDAPTQSQYTLLPIVIKYFDVRLTRRVLPPGDLHWVCAVRPIKVRKGDRRTRDGISNQI